MNNLQKRVLTTLIILPVSFFFIIKGGNFLIFFSIFIFLAGAYELISVFKKKVTILFLSLILLLSLSSIYFLRGDYYFPQILLFSILFSVFTNSSVKTNIFTFILTLIFFSINTVMVNIIFQMFTSFNNRFVQFILIVPIYMALSFFIAPIWLGINLHLTNIYLLMYLGITIVIYSYTSFYLERGKL